MTKVFLITDPDYGPNPDLGSGLRIRITDPVLRIQDYGPGFRNRDRDNFGHDMLKMEQDLAHFDTDNFSRDDQTNDASDFGPSVLWTKCDW